jgi:hypothetical protein
MRVIIELNKHKRKYHVFHLDDAHLEIVTHGSGHKGDFKLTGKIFENSFHEHFTDVFNTNCYT